MSEKWVTGERIKKKRLEKKWTMEDLANKAGINRSTISRYESGEVRNISITKLYKIAKALDTDVEYLMNDNLITTPIAKDLYEQTRDIPDFLAEEEKEDIRNFLLDYFSKLAKLSKYLIEHDFTDEEIDELTKYAGFLILKRSK